MASTPTETTPLLPKAVSTVRVNVSKPTQTPLPYRQIFVLCLMRAAEPIAYTVIFPFVVEMIRSTGIAQGHENRLGYYAGLVESIFALCAFCTVASWGRLSDRIGRKPVLLMGLMGSGLSISFLGLSTTFYGILISRCLAGALNGNVAVVKSMMGELTDETNQGRAFSILPLSWSLGTVIGPLMGGFLSHPAEAFPSIFGNFQYFITHPYALPCLVAGGITLLSISLGQACLEETLPSTPGARVLLSDAKKSFIACISTTVPARSLDIPSAEALQQTAQPPQMKEIWTRDTITAFISYSLLAFETSAMDSVLVLFASTPIEKGGLNLTPKDLGIALSGGGIFTIFFQVLIFPILHERYGTRGLYKTTMSMFAVVLCLFPVMKYIASSSSNKDDLGEETKQRIWAALWVYVFFKSFSNMAFGASMLQVNASVPARKLLGATNGVAQMFSALMRSIGPMLISSLFAYSITYNILEGQLAFLFLIIVGIIGACSTWFLDADPKGWRYKERVDRTDD